MNKQIGIYSPSFKRAKQAKTQEYLSCCTYVVCEAQADEYEAQGHRILVCPDSAQGNVSRVRNWILRNTDEPWVLMLDDDIAKFGRFIGNVRKWMDEAEALEFVEAHYSLAESWGVNYWGINCVSDKGSFREYTPFATMSFIGGPFQAFLDKTVCYDERLSLKEDYDIQIQLLNRDRKLMRVNYAHFQAHQHTNRGGCANYRTIEKEKQQFALLQAKWGRDIVRRDPGKSQVHSKKNKTYDINPIIKVPIGGV